MKHFLIFASVLFLLSSCSIFSKEKKNSPEYVSKMFLTHFQKLEFDEAAEFGTEKTKLALKILKSLSNMVPEETRNQNTFSNAEVQNCTVDGNTAQCTYTANGKTETINLVRQDGTWLVDLKLEQKKKSGPGK